MSPKAVIVILILPWAIFSMRSANISDIPVMLAETPGGGWFQARSCFMFSTMERATSLSISTVENSITASDGPPRYSPWFLRVLFQYGLDFMIRCREYTAVMLGKVIGYARRAGDLTVMALFVVLELLHPFYGIGRDNVVTADENGQRRG